MGLRPPPESRAHRVGGRKPKGHMAGTDQNPEQPTPADRSRERADVLREVTEHVARKQASAQVAAPRSDGTGRMIRIVNVLILAFAGYVWLGTPSWVQVERPPGPPPEELESALRLSMYIQVQQIESFRRQNDRIPSSLQEVGPSLSGMHFQRLGRGAYRLTGINDEITLVYSSSQSLAEFVGNSDELLFGGGGSR